MNFFDHEDLGNHLLQLCPKVVKHPVYIYFLILSLVQIILTFYVKQALKFKYPPHRMKVKVLRIKNSDVENILLIQVLFYALINHVKVNFKNESAALFSCSYMN